jgi:hypothetical protein
VCRPGPSLERLLDLRRERRVEIGADRENPLGNARFAHASHLIERHQSGYGLAGLGDDDLLAQLDPLEELGKSGLS